MSQNPSWKKAILTHGKWYLLSSFFTKSVSFFLLPLYTTQLSPSDYGIIEGFASIANLMSALISLRLDAAFIKYFHDYRHDQRQLTSLFSSVYWTVFGFGIFLTAICLLTSRFWLDNFVSGIPSYYVYLGLIPPLFLQLGSLGISFLRQSLKIRQTTIVEMTVYIFSASLTAFLLLVIKLGVLSNLIGTAVSAALIMTIYTILFVRKGVLTFSYDFSITKKCLRFSLPIMPLIASSWLGNLADRLIIANQVGLAALGLYGLGYKLAQMVYMVQDAITQVQGTLTMSELSQGDKTVKIRQEKFLLLLFGFLMTMHLGILLFNKEVVALISNKKFEGAETVFTISAMAFIFGSLCRTFQTNLAYFEKNGIVTFGHIISALTSFVLNLIFIKYFGYNFASVSFLITNIVFFGWCFFQSQKYIKLDLKISKFAAIAGIHITITILFITFWSQGSSFTIVGSKLLLFLCVSMIYLKLASPELLRRIMNQMRQ